MQINTMITFLKNFLQAVLGYIFPFKCISCTTLVTSANSFCTQCWSELNFITKPFCNICGKSLPFTVTQDSWCLKCMHKPPIYDLARGVLHFDDKSKKLIHYFKYYDKTGLAKVFAKNLYNLYLEEINKYDLILPVPMHKLKRMLRFYNHAFILGQEISLLSHKPIYSNVLLKNRWTKSQAKLSKKQRDNNLNNSFVIKNPDFIMGRKVILVDDVLTTGSTASACSAELKKYASSVLVLCVAFTSLN